VEKYGTAGQATDDNIIRRMRFAYWINKATDTHSEFVTVVAFPRQQWLSERASMLRYTSITSLVPPLLSSISFVLFSFAFILFYSLFKFPVFSPVSVCPVFSSLCTTLLFVLFLCLFFYFCWFIIR
jgi:hypothetical protein